MTTKFRSYAEREDTGERAYLFGFRRRPKLALHDDSRESAYYLHHHGERVKALADHLNKSQTYHGHVGVHRAAQTLATVAHNTHYGVKGFDKHNPLHHQRLAEHAFHVIRSESDQMVKDRR